MAPDVGSLSVWRAGWSLPAEAQHVCLVQSPFEFQPGRSCAHSSQYLTLASVQTQSEMKMALPPLLPDEGAALLLFVLHRSGILGPAPFT